MYDTCPRAIAKKIETYFSLVVVWWCCAFPFFPKMTSVSEITSVGSYDVEDESLCEEDVNLGQKSKIAIKLSYSKLGQTEYSIHFDQYVKEFSFLHHALDKQQWVHPVDLGVSPTLVSRYMFYRKQIKRLTKDGIEPSYAEELMTLLETQILDTVREFVEPTRY